MDENIQSLQATIKALKEVGKMERPPIPRMMTVEDWEQASIEHNARVDAITEGKPDPFGPVAHLVMDAVAKGGAEEVSRAIDEVKGKG